MAAAPAPSRGTTLHDADPAAATDPSTTSPGDHVRLTRASRLPRLAVVAVVLALLAVGSWKGTDDAFPVGPFVMFAFTTPPDGEVRSAAVEAVDDTGRRLPVALEPEEVGLRRAEMEGQLGKVVADPSRLGALAAAHARLRPEQPRWQQVDLVEHRVQLHQGRASGETRVVLASWHR